MDANDGLTLGRGQIICPFVAAASAGRHGKKEAGTMIDRSEVSRSLAKAIAYKQCGKQAEAEAWARLLVQQLECADILKAEG